MLIAIETHNGLTGSLIEQYKQKPVVEIIQRTKIKSKIVMQMRIAMVTKIINQVKKKCDSPNVCRIKIEADRVL